MQSHNGLPILGAANNGGGSLAAIDQSYAVELTTADGGKHVYAFQMGRPLDAEGKVDLGALKAFNPPVHAIEAVVERVGAAWWAPPSLENLGSVMRGGEFVVWRHVVSFRFLGQVPARADKTGGE